MQDETTCPPYPGVVNQWLLLESFLANLAFQVAPSSDYSSWQYLLAIEKKSQNLKLQKHMMQIHFSVCNEIKEIKLKFLGNDNNK